MLITKKIRLLFILLLPLVSLSLNAQQTVEKDLFKEFLPSTTVLSAKSNSTLSAYQARKGVKNIQLVTVNSELKTASYIDLNTGTATRRATKFQEKTRKSDDYSWFGQMEDGTGIFVTSINGQFFSKFYIDEKAYTLMPLDGDKHMLIEVELGELNNICGNTSLKLPDEPKDEKSHANDDPCLYRILIAYTQAAEAGIPMNLGLFSQGLVDEANMAYMMSDIDMEAELAIVVRVTYTESAVLATLPSGGMVTRDLARFRNDNDGFMDEIHDIRNVYRTDVQCLVRNGHLEIGGGGLAFGAAFVVDATNAADAFCAMSEESLDLNRFTFTHEIGHLMGAFHNEGGTPAPNFARGHVFATGGITNRTLMSFGCDNFTGCRVTHFSNPGINFGGNATGTATRDNARRLDQTSDRTRNYRTTQENLTIGNENVNNEIIANHLANHTITSNGNLITNNGGRLTLRAGEQIILNPGFRSMPGALVLGYIDNNPCETQPIQLNIAQEDNSEMEETIDRTSEIITVDDAVLGAVKAYPNPFSGELTLTYELPQESTVQVTVLNANGKIMDTFANAGTKAAGKNVEIYDGSHLPNGIYFLKIQTDDKTNFLKVVLSR